MKLIRVCVIMIALTSTLVACSGAFDRVALLRPEAAHVEVITVQPEGCEELGELTVMGRSETDREEALDGTQNDLRNQAHDLGATHVLIRNTDQRRSAAGMWRMSTRIEMTGVALRCAAPAEEPAPEPPVTHEEPTDESAPEASDVAENGAPDAE